MKLPKGDKAYIWCMVLNSGAGRDWDKSVPTVPHVPDRYNCTGPKGVKNILKKSLKKKIWKLSYLGRILSQI